MAKGAKHFLTAKGKMRARRILQTRVQVSRRDILASKTSSCRINLKDNLYVYSDVLGELPSLSGLFSAFLVEFALEKMVVDIEIAPGDLTRNVCVCSMPLHQI